MGFARVVLFVKSSYKTVVMISLIRFYDGRKPNNIAPHLVTSDDPMTWRDIMHRKDARTLTICMHAGDLESTLSHHRYYFVRNHTALLLYEIYYYAICYTLFTFTGSSSYYRFNRPPSSLRILHIIYYIHTIICVLFFDERSCRPVARAFV